MPLLTHSRLLSYKREVSLAGCRICVIGSWRDVDVCPSQEHAVEVVKCARQTVLPGAGCRAVSCVLSSPGRCAAFAGPLYYTKTYIVGPQLQT